MTYRLVDYLDHIQQAATNAADFIEGLTKEDFLTDKRTQQAAIYSLIIIGEAAAKVMDEHATFVLEHPEIPWRSIRNMRNRMAHGYFEINLDIAWETLQVWVPELIERLSSLRGDTEGKASQDPAK